MLTCANCGNNSREGARFCGSCGAPFVPAAPEPSRVEPPPPPSPGGKHRLRWVAVGAAIALLVAGGAVAAALTLTGEDGSTEVFDPITVPTTEADTTEPAPGELSDEAVTALINEAMSQRTEVEFGVLGSAPLGAEVRDCHKDVSESSLFDPGETQWILYPCEVWYEGELWDALLQSVDSDGNLYRAE